MWRSFRIFLLGGVFGAICGIALGLFLFPFLFPPPEAMERLTGAEQATLIADGTFVHADANDPIHWGKGKVSVYQGTVFLHEDFEVEIGRAHV